MSEVDPGQVSAAMLLGPTDVGEGVEETDGGPYLIYGDSYEGDRLAFFGTTAAWEDRLNAGGGGSREPDFGGVSTEVHFVDDDGADHSEEADAFGHAAFRLAGDDSSGRFLVEYVWVFGAPEEAQALVDNFVDATRETDREEQGSAIALFFGSLWEFEASDAELGDRSATATAYLEDNDGRLDLLAIAEGNAVVLLAEIADPDHAAEGPAVDLADLSQVALERLATV